MSRFFEDIRIGEQIALGSHEFSRDEIVRFATKYDPQRFHIDEEAAQAGPFGGLIASGWQTAATWMKLLVAYRQAAAAAETMGPGERRARTGPSPGLRELKWLIPVRPGDTVAYTSRVIEKVELASRPNWGLVVSRNEGLNQHGQTVLSFVSQVYVERRAPKGQAAPAQH